MGFCTCVTLMVQMIKTIAKDAATELLPTEMALAERVRVGPFTLALNL